MFLIFSTIQNLQRNLYPITFPVRDSFDSHEVISSSLGSSSLSGSPSGSPIIIFITSPNIDFTSSFAEDGSTSAELTIDLTLKYILTPLTTSLTFWVGFIFLGAHGGDSTRVDCISFSSI